jgi:hypothetical protein
VDFTQSEQLFNFAEGQAFLDGRQIGWIGLGLFRPEHRRKAEYFRECARYRIAAKKYVTYGRLITPIYPLSNVPTFTDDNFGWSRKHRGKAPLAEGRLWQAEDGRLGVLLANYSDEEIAFTWRVDPARYGMKGGSYTLTDLTPEGARALGATSGAIERTEKLAARKVRVIEVAPR